MISWRDTLLARHVYNLDPDAINCSTHALNTRPRR